MFNLLFFLILPFFGWATLRIVLGVTSLVYLLPFSCIFGLATFLVLVYGFAFFLGIQKASIIALILLFVIAIVLVFLRKNDFFKIENPLKASDIVLLSGICLFLAFFTFLLSDKWVIWDFRFHISVANYFVRTDKFPIGASNWPSLFVPYHYGFDLLSAIIVKLTGINAINSFHLIVIASSITTFLSAFAISYYFTTKLQNARPSTFDLQPPLWGALFFYFSGNLLWLDALFRYFLKIYPVDNSWSLFQTLCALGMHGSIINDIGSGGILFASGTLGMQLFLLLLFLFIEFLCEELISIKHLVLIFIASLALFHIAEWILYVFLLALFLTPVISLLFRNDENLKNTPLKILLCSILIIIIISGNSFAYRILSRGYSYLPSFLPLVLNPNLFSLETFGRFGNLNEHRNISLFSWDFVCEFGFQLIFSLFVLSWIIKKNLKGANFIVSFLLISFLSPFFLYIKSSPPDSLRLFHPGFELLSTLFALWLFSFRKLKSLIPVFSFVVILPSVCTLILSGIFSPSIYLNHAYIGFLNFSINEIKKDGDINKFLSNIKYSINLIKKSVVIDDSDINVAKYLASNSKADENGISNSPLPFDYVGIPCYFSRAASLPRRVTYYTLLRTFDPYLLKELKIKWFYLDPNTSASINGNALQELYKNGYLQEDFSTTSPIYPGIQFRLFKFVNLDEYISKYPRKAYWTYIKYFEDNLIPITNPTEQPTIYLFKSEKEATSFLKDQIKINPEFKKYNPFVDAVDETIIKQQALINGLALKYVN